MSTVTGERREGVEQLYDVWLKLHPYNTVAIWIERSVFIVIFLLANSDYYDEWPELSDSHMLTTHFLMMLMDVVGDSRRVYDRERMTDMIYAKPNDLSVLRFMWAALAISDVAGITWQLYHLTKDASSTHIEQLVMMLVLFAFTLARGITQGVFGCRVHRTGDYVKDDIYKLKAKGAPARALEELQPMTRSTRGRRTREGESDYM
jgi:hypothetical protein